MLAACPGRGRWIFQNVGVKTMKKIKKGDCFESSPNHFVEVQRTVNDGGSSYVVYIQKNKNYLQAFAMLEKELKYKEFKKLFGGNPYKTIGFNRSGALVM